MTRLELEIAGNVHSVAFEAAGGHLRVLVDGTEHRVDARAVDGFFYSLLVDGRSYEVTVERNSEGFVVQTGNESVHVLPLDPLRASREDGQAGASGPRRIRAVMPGRVVRVHVTAGDEVEKGAPLVVLEAMKMENEVLAPSAGRIATVAVREGEAVEGGADLVVFE